MNFLSSGDFGIPHLTNFPEEHSEQVISFAANMGLALSNWAHLEDSLCDLYYYCFGFIDTQTAAIAFRSTKGSNTRLSAINEALNVIGLNKTALADWSNIYNRISSKGKIRDKLAHAQIFHYQRATGKWNIVALPFTGYRTSMLADPSKPQDIDKMLRKRFTGNFTPLTAKDVLSLLADTNELTGRTEAFAAKHGAEIVRLRGVLARKHGRVPAPPDPNAPTDKDPR